jgi:hypothetical protein
MNTWTNYIQSIQRYKEYTDMANSFASLKKSRNSSLDKLLQETAKLNDSGQQQSNGPDERIWKPTVDKAGNGYAVIRFLPEPSGEELPWVRVFDHGFQGPGGWYIENSLTTLNQKDPVSEYNSELWNNGTDAGKEQARKQKRRLKYFSNILVVKDPSNPQNEGKVFLYQYGKKIWDKINDLMQPEFEDETPVNPFDFWEGADFKLKIRNVEGYRNYDKSEFDSPSELFDGDDEQLETVYNSLNSLSELVAPDKFKSYDELKQKLDKVLGLTGGASVARPAFEEVDEIPFDPTPQSKTADAPKSPVATAEDDDLSFFEQLAND